MKYLFKRTVQYFKNILTGIDYLGNAVLGGNPRELISFRLGRWKAKGSTIAKVICKIMTVTLFGALHCDRAYKEPGKGEAINDTPIAGISALIILVITGYFVV